MKQGGNITCFHDETVDGINNVVDIMSLLYGVA
jgi:hypothetical protein